MSFSFLLTDSANGKSKPFLPVHFWNGLLFGSIIWTILAIGAFLTDCAIKLIA